MASSSDPRQPGTLECGRSFPSIRGAGRCARPQGHGGDCSGRERKGGPPVFGVPTADDLPPGWKAEGVIVLVRAVDADGRRRITQIEGGDIMLWECAAMARVAARDFDARLDRLEAGS
jgi:hypothetical protein